MRPHPWVFFPIAASVFTTLLLAGSAEAYPPAHLWSKSFGSNQSNEAGNALAADVFGNIILGGRISGSTDFGGGLITHAGFADGVLAKYDSNGNYVWSRRMGGSTQDDYVTGLKVDPSGNIYAIGYFSGTVDFGSGALASAGSFDVYVVKLSPTGAFVWNKRFGSTGTETGRSIALDNSGNVYITGEFSGTVNFGGSNLVSSGASDVFLVKLDNSGNHVASARFGSASGEESYGVATDPSGNVLITGFFLGTCSFGGANLVSAGGLDIFVAKYSGSLVHVWSKGIGGTASDRGNAIATGPSGEAYVTGNFTETVNFGGGPLAGGTMSDAFLVKYAADGTHLWSQGFGSASTSELSNAVAVDGTGRPCIAGRYSGSIDFGGGPLFSVSGDVFVAHFDASGVHRWSGSFGGTADDVGNAIVTDPAGDISVTGSYPYTINFGGSTLTSVGPSDIFLAKLSGPPAEPVITSIADIPNDQGRKVKIRFDRAAQDGVYATPITEYQAYRLDAPGPSSVGTPAGLSPDNLLAEGWTFVGAVPAHGNFNYGIDAPTIGDSTIATGPYDSVFFIRAATASSTVYFDSPPMSGYSLDNLAPGIPLNLVYNAGDLAWSVSSAEDFDYFTVYGSNADAFGSAVVVNYSTAPAMDVGASPYAYYFVTATDFSGNEGKPAKVNTRSGAGGTPPRYVLSVTNHPNPFNPGTRVSYTVPSTGAVTITVHDAQGAKVATLMDVPEHAAGLFSLEWNGRDEAGVFVTAGIYFARILHTSGTRSRKMVLVN